MICVSKKKSYLKSQNLKIFGQGNLHGKVEISGAKNSALVLLASSLLTNEKIILENVPRLTDIEKMGNILKSLGVNLIPKLLRILPIFSISVRRGTFSRIILSLVSNDEANKTKAEFLAPLISTFPCKLPWPEIFKF